MAVHNRYIRWSRSAFLHIYQSWNNPIYPHDHGGRILSELNSNNCLFGSSVPLSCCLSKVDRLERALYKPYAS